MQWPFPIIASLSTFFVGFLIHHGNYYYVPFWYFPSFLLVFLSTSAAWRAVAVPALVLIFFVPQYVVGYAEAHKYARQGELQVARSIITNRGTDLTHSYIFGDFNFWPVFKDLSFRWSVLILHHARPLPADLIYLICGIDLPFSPEESVCTDALPTFGDMQLIGHFSWADRRYLVYERRGDAGPRYPTDRHSGNSPM
jgi:hypothetical protein